MCSCNGAKYLKKNLFLSEFSKDGTLILWLKKGGYLMMDSERFENENFWVYSVEELITEFTTENKTNACHFSIFLIRVLITCSKISCNFGYKYF